MMRAIIALILGSTVIQLPIPDDTVRFPDVKQGDSDIEIRELRPGVWVHTSHYTYPSGARFPANGLIVRDGDALLLIDTAWGEMLTATLLRRIAAQLGLPVRRAVVTHSHYDRLAGTDVLESHGIEVLAHPQTQVLATAQGTPVPNERVAGVEEPGAAVPLGPVEVFYPGPGHAPENLMVWVPSERVLFGGCAVRAAAARSLGATSDADLASWRDAINRAQKRYRGADVVVPGHGAVGGVDLLEHTLELLRQRRP